MWAHILWIFFSEKPLGSLPKRLRQNSVIEWQERNYVYIFVMANAAPIFLASFLWSENYIVGLSLTALRICIAMNAIFLINSIGHSIGSREHSTDCSSRDNWWMVWAMGDQYHNYHHAHPSDYRHGHKWYAIDPTKWLILSLWYCGLAWNLHKPRNGY